MMLYLEDLYIGQHFVSREYEMTLDEILQFAEKFDPQTFHTDVEQAKQHPIFRGLAASGWHTAAVVMRLWTECFPIANGLIGSEVNLRWPQPTRPGDHLHVDVEITDIVPSRSKPDRAMVSYQTKAFNQHQQVIYTSSTKIMVFKKAES